LVADCACPAVDELAKLDLFGGLAVVSRHGLRLMLRGSEIGDGVTRRGQKIRVQNNRVTTVTTCGLGAVEKAGSISPYLTEHGHKIGHVARQPIHRHRISDLSVMLNGM